VFSGRKGGGKNGHRSPYYFYGIVGSRSPIIQREKKKGRGGERTRAQMNASWGYLMGEGERTPSVKNPCALFWSNFNQGIIGSFHIRNDQVFGRVVNWEKNARRVRWAREGRANAASKRMAPSPSPGQRALCKRPTGKRKKKSGRPFSMPRRGNMSLSTSEHKEQEK